MKTTYLSSIVLGGLLAATGSVFAGGDTGGSNCNIPPPPPKCTFTVDAKHHLVTVNGTYTATCDRTNIQNAINAIPKNNDYWTVLLNGNFLFDGGPQVQIARSNLTITGVPFLTNIQGVTLANGLPAYDSDGPNASHAAYAYYNRAFSINSGNAAKLTQNVTFTNVHFSGFARSVNTATLAGTSNLCTDVGAGAGGSLNNINVIFNSIDNSERSPQFFGAVSNSQIGFNKSKSGQGLIISGGYAGCFPLVGDTVITTTAKHPAGSTFTVFNASTNPHGLLAYPLTVNPSTGLCNNGGGGTGTLAQLPVNGVCPVCGADVVGGEANSPSCDASDDVYAGISLNNKVIGNILTADETQLPRLGYVNALEIEGFNGNFKAQNNELSGGNSCLILDEQTLQPPDYLLSSPVDISHNYFHDCGASQNVAGLRNGAVNIGDNYGYDANTFTDPSCVTPTNPAGYCFAGSISVSPPLSFATAVSVHDNLYKNNLANSSETVFPVFYLGLPITDTTPGYEVVNRDVWLAEQVAYGNTVNEGCKVKVFNPGPGTLFVPSFYTPNIITPAIGANCH